MAESKGMYTLQSPSWLVLMRFMPVSLTLLSNQSMFLRLFTGKIFKAAPCFCLHIDCSIDPLSQLFGG